MSQKRELLVIESRPISVRTRGHLASNRRKDGSLVSEQQDLETNLVISSSFSPANKRHTKQPEALTFDVLCLPNRDQHSPELKVVSKRGNGENQQRRQAVATTAKASTDVFTGLRPGMGRKPKGMDSDGRRESQGTPDLFNRREEVCHAYRLS